MSAMLEDMEWIEYLPEFEKKRCDLCSVESDVQFGVLTVEQRFIHICPDCYITEADRK